MVTTLVGVAAGGVVYSLNVVLSKEGQLRMCPHYVLFNGLPQGAVLKVAMPLALDMAAINGNQNPE